MPNSLRAMALRGDKIWTMSGSKGSGTYPHTIQHTWESGGSRSSNWTVSSGDAGDDENYGEISAGVDSSDDLHAGQDVTGATPSYHGAVRDNADGSVNSQYAAGGTGASGACHTYLSPDENKLYIAGELSGTFPNYTQEVRAYTPGGSLAWSKSYAVGARRNNIGGVTDDGIYLLSENTPNVRLLSASDGTVSATRDFDRTQLSGAIATTDQRIIVYGGDLIISYDDSGGTSYLVRWSQDLTTQRWEAAQSTIRRGSGAYRPGGG